MNPLLDGLFKLFPSLKKIKALNNIHLTVNIGNKYEIDNRKILLDYGKLNSSEKKEILSRLPKTVEQGYDLLEENFDKKAKQYKETVNDKSSLDILSFFKDKIPPNDLPILKASLYLKHLLDSRQETAKVKNEIILRFGDRGRNISNLCSANYFLSWFKPLYEEISKSPNFTLDRFIAIYDEIVHNLPFTIFVNAGMKEEEVKQIITEKIESMKNYGLENLYIHGIGKPNILRIKKVVNDLINDGSFSKSIQEENKIIVVTLRKARTN